MGKITFFDNKQEGEPDNGLAKPHAELRDWTSTDERRLPEIQDLIIKYPEAFSQQANSALMDEQRRAIYPEAYDPIASAKFVDENIRTSAAEPVRKEKRVIHHRVLDVMQSLVKPREMRAPGGNGFGKSRLKRVKTPGHSRASVRDILRDLLKYL